MFFLVFYVLAYWILRLLASDSLDWDESEQFINSQSFNLGDGQQPPLFSWIVRLFLLGFGSNPFTVISVRYLCLLVFCLSIYFSAKYFFGKEKAFWLNAAVLAFIPSYGYTINFKLTHSVLVFSMAAFSFFIYTRLLKDPNSLNYLLLGSALGLGMLSKYNFLFFLVGLLVSNFFFYEGKKLIFNPRIFLSFFSGLAICIPHYIWLVENNFNAFHYSASRGGFNAEDLNPFMNFFKLSFNASEQLLVFLFVLTIISFPVIRFKNLDTKILNLRIIALSSFSVSLLILNILGVSKLISGWLSTIHFTIAFALFSFVDWNKLTFWRKIFFKLLVITMLLVFFIIKLITAFSPDLFRKKPMDFLIPQAKISYAFNSFISELKINPEELLILVQEEKIYANLKIRNPKLNIKMLQDLEFIPLAKNYIFLKESGEKTKKNKLMKNIFKSSKEKSIKYINSNQSFDLILKTSIDRP